MISGHYRGTNRDRASDTQIFSLCELLWTDEILHPAFNRVGLHHYFEIDEYVHIHKMITEYWQATGGNIYLGDLFLAESIVRHVAADEFPDINSEESKKFIAKHRPKRNEDGSLKHGIAATVDEVLDLVQDLRSMIGIKEFCDQTKEAYEAGDRKQIERLNSKENYLAERFRRKRGFMDKLGYTEAFSVLRDILCGEYKQELNSQRLRERIAQGLQFWDY